MLLIFIAHADIRGFQSISMYFTEEVDAVIPGSLLLGVCIYAENLNIHLGQCYFIVLLLRSFCCLLVMLLIHSQVLKIYSDAQVVFNISDICLLILPTFRCFPALLLANLWRNYLPTVRIIRVKCIYMNVNIYHGSPVTSSPMHPLLVLKTQEHPVGE